MTKQHKTRHPGVYLLEDGRFLVRWTRRGDGPRRDNEETLAEGASIEDAVALRAERIKAAKKGSLPTLKPNEPPALGDYARSWLAARAPTMKRSAALSYAAIFEDHILIKLGHLRVDRITREHVQGWVVWIEQQKRPASHAPGADFVPYARDTLIGWWTKLKQLLRDAAADFGTPDPTSRIAGPKAYGRPRVHEVRTLAADELTALINEVPDAWSAEVYTMAVTGLRPGELYALTWDDIEFDRGFITVRKAVYQGVVAAPKTGKTREVSIGPDLATLLANRRRELVRAQHPALATGLVFPSTDSGRGWHRGASSLLNQLVRSGKRAGIAVRVTPQVLRRTVNTLMTGDGVDRLVQRALMGHSSESMTERYYHAPADKKLAAVTALERKIRGE